MITTRPRFLCIYHDECIDGFTAAWIVHHACLGDVELYGAKYNTEPPYDNIEGADVIITDFSYKREQMLQIFAKAASVLVLDHHKTAQTELAGLPGDWDNCTVIFDMERSGAGLTWDYFNLGIQRPMFVNCVEDRDLWRFRYDFTKQVHQFIISWERTLENWDKIANYNIEDILIESAALDRKFQHDLKLLLKAGEQGRNVHGNYVPVCNAPYFYSSEICHEMLQRHPESAFSMSWYDSSNRRVFSLRSTDDRLDVSEIAKQYGGGGHRNAAGFVLPHGEWPREE